MRRLSPLLALLCALACPAAVRADPPFAVDDARTLEPGKFRLDNYFKHQRRLRANEYSSAPAYSPHENVELSLSLTQQFAEDGDVNELALGAKWLGAHVDEHSIGWGFSIDMNREDASGERARYSPSFGAVLSFALDEEFTLHLNAGLFGDRDRHRVGKSWGLQAEYSLDERWTLIAETYGESDSKPALQFGFTYVLIPERMEMDVLYGRQDEDEELRWGAVGLRLYW